MKTENKINLIQNIVHPKKNISLCLSYVYMMFFFQTNPIGVI